MRQFTNIRKDRRPEESIMKLASKILSLTGSKKTVGSSLLFLVAVAAVALTASPSASASTSPYLHSQTVVGCNTYVYPNRTVALRTITVSRPSLTSTYLPTMNVSWQPVLYRAYPGSSSWGNPIATGPELWGSTAFGAAPAPEFAGWTVSLGNVYYQVRIVYRWYWNGAVWYSEPDNTSTHINWSIPMNYDGRTGIGQMGPTGSSCLMDA